jgi:CheY-like chemotaxis protein
MDAVDSTGKTVLVVEDRDMEREGLATVLRREGYTVLTAANGQQALELLLHDPLPDLVLLDMLLAGIDGWDILQIRKRTPALADVPFVIVTGLGNASPGWARSLGVADYLRKPLEIPTLLETVRRWCHPGCPAG